MTCSQWQLSPPKLKASIVRGVLESLGYASINSVNRGSLVWSMVNQIDAYCAARVINPYGVLSYPQYWPYWYDPYPSNLLGGWGWWGGSWGGGVNGGVHGGGGAPGGFDGGGGGKGGGGKGGK